LRYIHGGVGEGGRVMDGNAWRLRLTLLDIGHAGEGMARVSVVGAVRAFVVAA